MATIKSHRKTTYAEKFKDPRWQKMRLKILERDEWACQMCGDKESTLHIHHRYYKKNADPWDYPKEALVTLCEKCHQVETDCMPMAMSWITTCLKEHFFTHDIIVIYNAINYACSYGLKNLSCKQIADAIDFALDNNERSGDLMCRYLEEGETRFDNKVKLQIRAHRELGDINRWQELEVANG